MKIDTMNMVKTGTLTIEETILHIVNAPSQGADLITREPTRDHAGTALSQPETIDVLRAFKTNLDRLDDLSSRLGFVMAEVRAVARR